MKPRDLLYFLGIQPKPQTYGYEITTFDLPGEGRIQYAQWLHPAESKKTISQDAIDELRKFILPGDAAIDIGAHSGDSTIPIALAAGAAGVVLALEPNPFVFPVLKKNAALNREMTNIIPLMFAATPQAGEFEFEYSDSGFCNGGFHEGISKWRHGHAFRLKVRGENLQLYLERNHPDLISKIRLIKVDAEGYDYAVLQSLEKLIMRQKPFIKCEVYKHLKLKQREKLFNFLASCGYEISRIDSECNYGGEKVTKEKLMTRQHYDVFCIPSK